MEIKVKIKTKIGTIYKSKDVKEIQMKSKNEIEITIYTEI